MPALNLPILFLHFTAQIGSNFPNISNLEYGALTLITSSWIFNAVY
jgi:hypothetical protein